MPSLIYLPTWSLAGYVIVVIVCSADDLIQIEPHIDFAVSAVPWPALACNYKN